MGVVGVSWDLLGLFGGSLVGVLGSPGRSHDASWRSLGVDWGCVGSLFPQFENARIPCTGRADRTSDLRNSDFLRYHNVVPQMT